MDREETLVDVVTRLDRSVNRLISIMEGDAALGVSGVTSRVAKLEQAVENLQSIKVSALQWMLGYLLFGAFVMLVSHTSCSWLGIPIGVGLPLGALFFVLAAVFFVSGLGWIRWR